MLGLKAHPRGGYAQHIQHALDKEEKRVLPRGHHSSELGCLFGKMAAHISLISESGLYKLIMRSDKPQAKAFQDWVTKEVLPSIRKTGSYSIEKKPHQLPLLDKPKGDRLEAIGVLFKDTVDALLGIASSQVPKRKAHRDFSRWAKGVCLGGDLSEGDQMGPLCRHVAPPSVRAR